VLRFRLSQAGLAGRRPSQSVRKSSRSSIIAAIRGTLNQSEIAALAMERIGDLDHLSKASCVLQIV
jgi:hypothetical protein